MALVLGVDSSTQSTKAVLVDADDGTVVESRSARHPEGTAVDPRAWLRAFDEAAAPLLPRAEALSVGGQQHGMVALDVDGDPVHDALLWNDTRSADAAHALIEELGGPAASAEAVGSVLVASFTATKLRWLRDHAPGSAARVHRVLLPHDYVSWHATGRTVEPFTDHGDASGTGYYSTSARTWLPDLAASALGHEPLLPHLVEPGAVAATTPDGLLVAAGTGDNMAAALGLGMGPGDLALSIGTSGVASSIGTVAPHDPSGTVTGFADATGHFLPMATTLNAARILDLQCRLLGVDHESLGRLAMESVPGAHGVTVLPYYGGERTPNRPDATGTWHGLTPGTTRADLARAAVEALLCSLADAADAVVTQTGKSPLRVLLTGGGSRNPAVQSLAPGILGHSVSVPAEGEYVALGAARQAAWALRGALPEWPLTIDQVLDGQAVPSVREAYAQLRDLTEAWS
ncbi:xylulokinase [Aeromicrobium sp. CTD01-1L150]|uniref:xylulokinase n=1 Tax=Aeromicrobium sp. CTD01-1L150 TaxID=3341830 RepID=UPI0035C0B974